MELEGVYCVVELQAGTEWPEEKAEIEEEAGDEEEIW